MGPIIRKLVMNPVLHNSPLAVQMLRRAIDTFDQGRAEELAAAFVADGTWHCPTLIRERTSELSDAAAVPGRPEPPSSWTTDTVTRVARRRPTGSARCPRTPGPPTATPTTCSSG